MISGKSVPDLIDELNEGDETEHLEAKSISSGELGTSVFETICALSNEPGLDGGTIILGVEREQMSLFPQYVAVGVGDDPDKVVPIWQQDAPLASTPQCEWTFHAS